MRSGDRERIVRCVIAHSDPSPSWGRATDQIRITLVYENATEPCVVVTHAMHRRLADEVRSEVVHIHAADHLDGHAGVRRKVTDVLDRIVKMR